MNAKTTKVRLVAGEMQGDFEFSHAERILKMKNNGGWILPADSPFEFVGDGLRYRETAEGSKGKKKVAATRQGKAAPVED